LDKSTSLRLNFLVQASNYYFGRKLVHKKEVSKIMIFVEASGYFAKN